MLHFNFFHLYLYYELEKGIVYNTVKIEFLKNYVSMINKHDSTNKNE